MLLFIAFVCASALAYLAIQVHQDISKQREARAQALTVAARYASEMTERFIFSWELVFSTLAESRCVLQKREPDCSLRLANLKRRFPDLTNLVAVDRSGEYYGSAMPFPDGIRQSAKSLKQFQEIANGRRYYVAPPHWGPISGHLVGALTVPVIDEKGAFDGVLGVSFRIDSLLTRIHQAVGLEKGGIAVVNPEGSLIAASDSSVPWMGFSLEQLGHSGSLDLQRDFFISSGGQFYRAHYAPVREASWGLIAYEPYPDFLETLVESEMGEFFLAVPIALLAIIAAIIAARFHNSEHALAQADGALRKALADTEAKVAERTEQLARRNTLYRSLFEQAPGGVVLLDQDGNILDCNANATRLSGYSAEELLTMNVQQLDANMTPSDVARWLTDTLSSDGVQTETVALRKDGTPYPILVSARAITDATGESQKILSFWSDLTDIQRERNLRDRLQQRLHAVVENTYEGIVLADSRGLIVYANPALCELTGWSPEEIKDKPVSVLIPEGDHAAHSHGFASAAESGVAHPTGRPVRRRCRHRSGSEFPIELTIATWFEQNAFFSSAIIRDLSEQQRSEARLLLTQKMEAIGLLASGVAHDFNNLLAIVMGHSDLIADATSASDPVHGYAKKITGAVIKARSIVRQLLDFSRAGDETPRSLSLPIELKEIEHLLHASRPRNVSLRFSTEELSGAVVAVPHQIQQIVINLVNNACDAIGNQSGSIEVLLTEETRQEDSCARIGNLAPGRYAVLRIRDNGPGIPDALLDKIFLPFFTTKPVGRGTGLGLAVVRGIMEGLNGAVNVNNRPNGGAIFELFFPIVDAQPVAAATEAIVLPGDGECVLVIDDELDVVAPYIEYLAQVGYSPIYAASATEALERIDQQRSSIRAAICDLVMPDMDGLALIAHIKKSNPNLPVILMTGRSDVLRGLDLVGVGIANVISKPVEPRILAGVLRQALDLHLRGNAFIGK